MRTYDLAITSLAIGAPAKWTDNVLSHHAISGVIAHERGVARKIPRGSLLTLAVVRELHIRLGLGIREAVEMAPGLLLDEPESVHDSGHLRVSLDRAALEREVDRRLRDALESAPTPRRGRPPGRTAAGR